MTTVNDLLNLIRVGVGLGPEFLVNFNDDFDMLQWSDQYAARSLLNKGLDNQAKLCIDVISNVENALMQALLKLTK